MKNSTDFYCRNTLPGPLIWAFITWPCVCAGLPASVALLWVLTQRQRQGLTNDIYMVNLTVMDLFSNISIPVININFLIWRNECVAQIADAMLSMGISGRPLFMTSTCVDCYMAVIHPITYMKTKDSQRKVTVCRLVCILVWGLTIAGVIAVAVDKDFMASPVSMVMLVFCIPAIAFLDAAILHTLRKQDPSGRGSVHPQKQRALQTITNSLVMTLVSYLPSLVIFNFSPLIPLTPQETACHILFPFSAANVMASAIMPLLCLQNLGRFKGLRWGKCPRAE